MLPIFTNLVQRFTRVFSIPEWGYGISSLIFKIFHQTNKFFKGKSNFCGIDKNDKLTKNIRNKITCIYSISRNLNKGRSFNDFAIIKNILQFYFS